MQHLDEMDEVMLRFFDSTKSRTELKPAKRPDGKLSQQTVAGTVDRQTNGQVPRDTMSLKPPKNT